MAISDAIMDIDLDSTSSSEKKTARVWENPLYPTNPKVRAKLKEAIELFKKNPEECIAQNYGMGVDTMPDQKLSGKPEWQKTVLKRNKLKASLVDIGMSLEPGETTIVPMFVQIRRVNETVEVVDDDDDESFDLIA